jgi:hypothetical protein
MDINCVDYCDLNVIQCSLLDIYKILGKALCFSLQNARMSSDGTDKSDFPRGLLLYPEYGGRSYLEDVDSYLPHYITSHPRGS